MCQKHGLYYKPGVFFLVGHAGRLPNTYSKPILMTLTHVNPKSVDNIARAWMVIAKLSPS